MSPPLPFHWWDLLKRIASTRVLRNTRIFKRSWYLSRPFETNFAYSLRDIRVGRSPHMDGDGDREGTAGDTDVGCRWCRAHLPATTRAALCGRSPACIRPVSRPQGPPNRSRAPGEMPQLRCALRSLRRRSCARALLTAVLVVQVVTYCPTSRTIGDREHTAVQRAQIVLRSRAPGSSG